MSHKIKNQTSRLLNQGGEWSKTFTVSTDGSGNFSQIYDVHGHIQRIEYFRGNVTQATTITITDQNSAVIDSYNVNSGDATRYPVSGTGVNNLHEAVKSIAVSVSGGQASKTSLVEVYFLSGWE